LVHVLILVLRWLESQAAGSRQEERAEKRRRDSPKGSKSENLIRKEKRIEDRGLTRTDPNPNPDP